ncbi:bifunctional 5,10-methylenetetrahydrofolate dehydrogenase/5,10-methenyltetrahydrofolate cyclohydrolase [Parelusimicrobium proximum]|uniref:bifunctional 5,10-methylenetetrahydrofolate dehydrogenase/5,10-methenyltetrahydrofolate cyclohydrolase n=1 Tax=Parelusimicrobium proximum TaxID=3228953 RepID=UPI003D16564C
MKILEGKTLAKKIRESLPARVEQIKSSFGRAPKVTGIGWGHGGGMASYMYLHKEMQAAQKTGIETEIIEVTEDTAPEAFLEIVRRLSADDSVDAILIPRPLPPQLNSLDFLETLNADKDIDGAATLNMGRLFSSKTWKEAEAMKGFVPCTALAVVRMLEHYEIPLKGKDIVVLGRSNTVGKPLAHMLTCKDATVTICHSRTTDLPEIMKRAEIVVSAIGKARFVKEDMIGVGATVIDVGTNEDENGVYCGDVDYDNVSKVASQLTPVPGGVGPVTLALLLENIVKAVERKIK